MALPVAAGISFSAAFILIYITFEFLIFREIEKVYIELKKVAGEANKLPTIQNIYASRNPIKRINKELVDYVSQQEHEIDMLKQHESYRREFIADISHELRTPIFAAQGYILTLQDGAINDKNVRNRFLKKAAKSLNRLDTLVRDLLTLSRIESGVLVMQKEVLDLQILVLDVFDQLEVKAKKKGIALKLTHAYEEGVYISADPNRLLQVFDNLVGNAISYGKENGIVEVSLKPDGKFVTVVVIDDGPGIPEEHLSRVFERFYRVEKSRSKKQGGSGLGLAITKHIIEGHDSTIKASSQLGEGTRFTFTLKQV